MGEVTQGVDPLIRSIDQLMDVGSGRKKARAFNQGYESGSRVIQRKAWDFNDPIVFSCFRSVLHLIWSLVVDWFCKEARVSDPFHPEMKSDFRS